MTTQSVVVGNAEHRDGHTIPREVVIVGASLGGLRTAQDLRAKGFAGNITLVGDEPHLPYDRPPLSKAVLKADINSAITSLTSIEMLAELDIQLRLGVPATHLDHEAQTVTLADKTKLGYDALVIATGVRARRLPIADAPGVGALYLRSHDDAVRLRERLAESRHIAVIGGGFISGEVASVARSRSIAVTAIIAGDNPLVTPLGPEVAGSVASLWARHGVDLRRRTTVVGAERAASGVMLKLSDGSAINPDAVIVGIGGEPCTEWLKGSGLDLDDGVVCDSVGRARSFANVYAVGDVARWDHPYYRSIRLDHWTSATEQASVTAEAILGLRNEPRPALPYFWSEQFDTRIQFIGRAEPGDDFAVIDGNPADEAWAGVYSRGGKDVACIAFNRPRIIAQRRRALTPMLLQVDLDEVTA